MNIPRSKPDAELRVGLLKFGKSTYFDPSGWKAIGADIEVRMLIQILCPLVKEVHFWGAYNLGPDDAARPTLPDNLVLHDKRMFSSRDYDKLVNDVETTAVDVMIVVNGPHSVNNRGVQMFERYVYPNLQIINRTKTPWVYLYSDPRYWIKAKELVRPPQKILAQYPLKNQVKRLQGNKIPMSYERLDIWGFWRFNTPKVDYPVDGRENVVRLVGNSKPGYWKLWNETYRPALDAAGISWEVWGIWPEAPADDARYKQTSIKQGWDTLAKTKHLLILVTASALDKGYPITGRWWELAMSDALVWVNDLYDHRGQLVGLNHTTRVKSGEQLANRILELESNPDKYRALVEEQRNRFSPDQEKPEFLGAQLLTALHDAILHPEQEAWPASMLNPQLSPSYETIDLSVDQVKDKAMAFPAGGKIMLNCGFRPYALIKKAFEETSDGFVTFDEVCGMFKDDPYFQHVGKDHTTKRDVIKSAVHCFSVLGSRGCQVVEATPEQLSREFPYQKIADAMPEYVPIDRSRRSAGAKRAGVVDKAPKAPRQKAAASADSKTAQSGPAFEGSFKSTGALKFDTSKISRFKKLADVLKEVVVTKSDFDDVYKFEDDMFPDPELCEQAEQQQVEHTDQPRAKRVPMQDRVLVATVTENPFRAGTATRVHFDQVLSAGPAGITYPDLARRIVETNTQGVQTGDRLAGWSFIIFTKKGLAKTMYRDGGGNMVEYQVATRKSPRKRAGKQGEFDFDGASQRGQDDETV